MVKGYDGAHLGGVLNEGKTLILPNDELLKRIVTHHCEVIDW